MDRKIENRIDIHDKIVKELLENKSVAAFLFLIPPRRLFPCDVQTKNKLLRAWKHCLGTH